MGGNGPRMYVPPNADPVGPERAPAHQSRQQPDGHDHGVAAGAGEKRGVISGYAFDAYWPGGTSNTGWRHNITALLTEVASARIATPVTIDPRS